MSKRILVNGAQGRMGQLCVSVLSNHPEFKVVAKTDKNDDLKKIITSQKINIVVDLTTALSVYENTKNIIEANAHPIIGTSGLTAQQIDEFKQRCTEQQLGGIIVPNFSLGAILMMKYAAEIARYYSDIEIIEYHHDQKVDSPSGTAIKTAEMIKQNKKKKLSKTASHETISGARGAEVDGISIHAIRMPGFMAHQTVIFGSQGETLKIQHDAISRDCFAPGIILACQEVSGLKTLVYGLEQLI